MQKSTNKLGKKIRERRQANQLSIRALAKFAGVSPSYISSIESGRNSTTGRAPEPSLRVLRGIAGTLDIALDDLVNLSDGQPAGGCSSAHEHLLLYSVADQQYDLTDILDKLSDRGVDRWVYISDPRNPSATQTPQTSDGRVYSWCWPFGAAPYPDEFLVPSLIRDALRQQLRLCGDGVKSEKIGLIIGDCSAVMRWMVNPETEIEYETKWPQDVDDVFEELFGHPPLVNVCVYQHADLEAIASRIDVLDAVIRLIQTHSDVIVIEEGGQLSSGAGAIQRILLSLRPPDMSSRSWNSLIKAAAPSLSAPA
ncbi:MAG: helix-turn-helix transcriptional regulator [Rhodospirillales bacterium]|jgi:transcriptional regulator with XRE-family HTH domain|nr:helix-turn-helix transcriptional regulator [Rhodospirillales bacterium]MBT4040652.1 helix-turn-helix transcriptional regulator [Rhodospirillales bacterium]MBT4626194.1 helix-turn-helix transcriptional regulator [Rhodospirillales bacterium]MBT5353220.1 helix-turn-helix transcriptional regulator [Rhodospirillales bacterium]MBT5522439.1 helix-turn-helix transcriptional regulator [Rhodospirillales bacterium]